MTDDELVLEFPDGSEAHCIYNPKAEKIYVMRWVVCLK